MAINMTTARRLCTKPELELVVESAATQVGDLSAAELRSRVRRARVLRDKYRTLASRQRRVARGKQEKRGLRPSKGNENTVRKQDLFDAVLGRFEAQLARAEGGRTRTAGGAKRKRTARSSSDARGAGARKPTKKTRQRATRKTGKKAGRKKAKKKAKESTAGSPARRTRRKAGRAISAGGRGGELMSASGGTVAGARSPARRTRSSIMAFGRASGNGSAAARNTSLAARSKATRRKRVLRRQQQTNRPAIGGHVSARGRRNQARRDSR